MVRDALRARALVGYFPERVSVYVDMTVQHYLRYVGEMKGLRRRDARPRRRHGARELQPGAGRATA